MSKRIPSFRRNKSPRETVPARFAARSHNRHFASLDMVSVSSSDSEASDTLEALVDDLITGDG